MPLEEETIPAANAVPTSVPPQGIGSKIEGILEIDFAYFAKNALPTSIPEKFDRERQVKFIALPFNQVHALSGSFNDDVQTNIILANDGILWVLMYPDSSDFREVLSTLPGSKVLVTKEYWNNENRFYPLSRVFLGYENP